MTVEVSTRRAVHVAGERRLGEPRTDARGDVRHRHGVIELLLRAVGKGYYGHWTMLQEVVRASGIETTDPPITSRRVRIRSKPLI